MAKRQSVLARSKKAEREVQQYLWPGSEFGDGAKRPWQEPEDLSGEDFDGRLWFGEVKERAPTTVHKEGGPWAVLFRAFEQCVEAIERNPHEGQVPRPFAVLRLKGTQISSPQNLVMYMTGGQLVVVPLGQFQRMVAGGA